MGCVLRIDQERRLRSGHRAHLLSARARHHRRSRGSGSANHLVGGLDLVRDHSRRRRLHGCLLGFSPMTAAISAEGEMKAPAPLIKVTDLTIGWDDVIL